MNILTITMQFYTLMCYAPPLRKMLEPHTPVMDPGHPTYYITSFYFCKFEDLHTLPLQLGYVVKFTLPEDAIVTTEHNGIRRTNKGFVLEVCMK